MSEEGGMCGLSLKTIQVGMKRLVVVKKDDAGYFVAEVPALPGCLSQGKTKEEALTNIRDAIDGWLEVMESNRPFDRKEAVEVVV